jgi:hypothetical protein
MFHGGGTTMTWTLTAVPGITQVDHKAGMGSNLNNLAA